MRVYNESNFSVVDIEIYLPNAPPATMSVVSTQPSVVNFLRVYLS